MSSFSTSLADLRVSLERWGARVQGDARCRVSGLRQDSRCVVPGDLFAARIGTKTNGVEFIPDAVARGATAVMVEAGTPLNTISVPVLEVDDLRGAIGLAAEAVHGHPSQHLEVVGVTGTNGKTTVAWLVEHALGMAGYPTGRLGTLGYSFDVDRVESPLTTPEADVVSGYLARARAAGATHFVLEASSHALAQARVDALRFAVAVFTNLTQDHLDYHESMSAYAAAKRRLFTELSPRAAVINVNDAFGAQLADEMDRGVVRVGRGEGADVFPREVKTGAEGVRGVFATPRGELELTSRLVGEHNLDNLLTVLGVGCALELDMGRITESLERVPSVPGRLERCDGPDDDVIVLVDYAHTPDALERALAAVRGLSERNLMCVFGCGGDRDPGKRPQMGDAVGRAATRAIISNDNPRTEDPQAIADAIEPAVKARGIPYEVILDRAVAIDRAIENAAAGDVVLIAGKGHEDYQIVGTTKRHFDDREEARRALARRRERGN